MRHIVRMKRPTNFKLGTQVEYEDAYRREAPSLPRSKVKVAMSRGESDNPTNDDRPSQSLACP